MLTQIKFAPGIDKQDTSVGAEGRWVDSDNVRFRYGLPEKVGGWSSLITDTMVGVARAMHAFTDLSGNRYVAIGTDKSWSLVVVIVQVLADVLFVANVELVKESTTPALLHLKGVISKSCPSKYKSKNLSVPIATYLLPLVSTKACCFLATPTIE